MSTSFFIFKTWEIFPHFYKSLMKCYRESLQILFTIEEVLKLGGLENEKGFAIWGNYSECLMDRQ